MKITPTTIRLEAPLMDQVAHQAAAQSRTVSDWIREACREKARRERKLYPTQGTAL